MQDNLTVTVFQTNIVWENAARNHIDIVELATRIPSATDVLVLPEMFTTGFTNNTSLAETMQGESIKFMQLLASKHNCAVCGSIIIVQGENVYNRFVFVAPEGTITTYDKRHLFALGGENATFAKGSSHVTIQFRGWRIRPLICYDIRFPVWSRNTDNYDLLLYVANWPAARNNVWNTLLSARAIENQCYVVGANRCGSDGMGIEYIGNSRIIDYKGEILCNADNGVGICSHTLNLNVLNQFRQKFPFLIDRDEFTILT